MSTYQFTDTDLAAQRLKYLANVYADSSRDFILKAVHHHPKTVFDLGCGPGYTTHMLADIIQCKQVVGLDNSDYFISLAERNRTSQLSFFVHNITRIPFPISPCDLLYCRFLLTHLDEPADVITKWASQIRSNGLLLIEETEGIDTKNEVFRTYLGITEALLAS